MGIIMIGLGHMSHIRPRSVPRVPLAGSRGHTFRMDHLLAAGTDPPVLTDGPLRSDNAHLFLYYGEAPGLEFN